MVVTYYIKLFEIGANRHNGILMSLLVLVPETFTRRNSQARSILSSHRNQVETSLSSSVHTCTDLDILIAGEMEEKGRTGKLVNVGVNSTFMLW